MRNVQGIPGRRCRNCRNPQPWRLGYVLRQAEINNVAKSSARFSAEDFLCYDYQQRSMKNMSIFFRAVSSSQYEKSWYSSHDTRFYYFSVGGNCCTTRWNRHGHCISKNKKDSFVERILFLLQKRKKTQHLFRHCFSWCGQRDSNPWPLACEANALTSWAKSPKKIGTSFLTSRFGDPYGNRTHDSAVKGRCLDLLTNGPNGSGGGTWTYDLPGMNRML